ncbi:MAG: [FeFe] hydrogenase H-cluster maturation GTPase HydF [Candidatus Cloacimonadaceae bacterium]
MSASIRGERLVITLLGKRNVGKSSLINAITGQETAIVSDLPGTTTDPVDKRFELVPIGPVTFYDTAGLDDIGELGAKRIQATNKVLFRTDMAIFVNDGTPFDQGELELVKRLQEMKIPHLVVFNKSDLRQPAPENIKFCEEHKLPFISVSAADEKSMKGLTQMLIDLSPSKQAEARILVGDLVKPGDRVVLVTPIDQSAPKGRIILPQVQVLRDLLDHNAIVTFTKDTELERTLASFATPPQLVITDSQVVQEVAQIVPEAIPLTTFSILFARYKGELEILARGVRQIDRLEASDRVLIAEACSHHAQEDDIGRVKIPRWINDYLGEHPNYEVKAGFDFPENLEDYALIIHCGACMLNQAEMGRRIMEAHRRNVPITNYGLAITKVQGVFERCVKVFGV